MNQEIISIGKVLPNYQIYILNSYLQPLPIGITGEIYIGGVGVARGYLNKPELTAEKFINNPFGEGKLYKTGDLARYLPDGNIEFIGRIDNQVKIRGFRIELGEIEATLNQHKDIKKTIVLAKENDRRDKYLVAYLIANKRVKITVLREYLGGKLPEYMIPYAFVFLDKFPLTRHGKIDKKALPNPNLSENRENEYIAPSNDVEIKLTQIWQEVLEIEKIGINDNFFALGGHSLMAVRMLHDINQEFKIEISLVKIFEYPTIKELAILVAQKQMENLTPEQLNYILSKIE